MAPLAVQAMPCGLRWPYRSGIVAASTAASPIAFTDPVLESGSDVWAPASLAFMPGTEPSLFAANLKGENLRRFVLDPANPDRVVRTEVPLNGYGRLRAAHVLPNGCLLFSTSNRDGRGVVRVDDDRIVRFCGGYG